MLTLALETKSCMHGLLLSDSFDHLSLIEGDIITFNHFTFDGFLQKDFYDEDALALLPEDQQYSDWKDLREFCFSIIKGKRTPLQFRFVFSLSRLGIASFLKEAELSYSLADVQGLYLNLKYDGTNLQCTTGTSLKVFTMDKSLEQAWDKSAQSFFAGIPVGFEVL